MIEGIASEVPGHLAGRSGKVFYSGRNAFSRASPLYLLGVNPGGSPDTHATETVGSHTQSVLQTFPADWSAYRDESWKGAAPGTLGMAPRVLHLLQRLELSPGSVPASNLVFVRSAREAHIERAADGCIGGRLLALSPAGAIHAQATRGRMLRTNRRTLCAQTSWRERADWRFRREQ